MKPLFKSADLQKSFERDGFVKIALLNEEEVCQLLDDYGSVSADHEGIEIPYITTSHSNNQDLIRKVDSCLQHVLKPAIERHMENYRLLFGNFLVKMPIQHSETAPHQDITFVDEHEFISVNIWVALQDTDETNGCMYFLPASHKFMHTIRPTHSYPWAYERVREEIKKHVVSFPAKAGEAFVFHHGVIHGSYANSATKPRLAAVMAAYHRDASLVHYYLPGGNGNTLKKYAMDKDAYLSFEKNNPPAKGVFVEELSYDFKQINDRDFRSMLGENSTGIFSKILKIFS